MKTVKKIAAAAMAIVMAVAFVPMLPGASAKAGAVDDNAKTIEPLPEKTAATAAEKTTAKTASVTAESPSIYTFESDFDALTQKYRRYPKISFGLEGKEWIVCGRQNDELVLICNPADSYGQTIFADDTDPSYEYSYETSQLDKTLQNMSGSGSTAFSKSEISLMKDVSVTLIGDYSHVSDSKYQITRKLYAPYPNEGTVKIGCGITDSMGDIQLSLSDSQFQGASFWTRAVNKSTVYKYENGSQTSASADDKSDIVPVMHLNLADTNIKPLFVSAAEPAKEDADIASTARTPSAQDTTLTMRYDGGNKVKYKAEYNSGRVTVKSDTFVHDEYLYVQWMENNVNKVKSIKLKDYTTANGGETAYTAEEIGGTGFSLTEGVKVWIEKKDDNLTYAKMGTRASESGTEVPDLVMSRSTNGEADGSLSGLDPNEEYEYCLYSKVKAIQDWIKVPEGSTEIKNLCSGNYQIRTAATAKRTAGPERMFRVKDIYDVTIDSNTNKVLMNEKSIDTYSVFGSMSVAISYAGDAVVSTLSKLSDNFDVKTVSELISKYAKNTKKNLISLETVSKLKKISEKLNALSVETDNGTKAIVGDVDSAELKKEWTNAQDAFNEFQEGCYGDFEESALQEINSFYSGGMADENKTDAIDSSLLYFYSDEDISQLTGKKNNKASGEEFYKDFTNLGEVILNAAPKGKEGTDMFTLCEGVYSHLYNFNSETFDNRDELYEKIFNFYEKGYAELSTSLAYNISNHKDQLKRITDLRTAAVGAETSVESEAIMKAIDTIAKETAKVYGLDSSSYSWTKLENLHNEQITKEKEALKELNAQYESIKAAYEKATKKLEKEKNRCNIWKNITCYRNQVSYDMELKVLSVNYKYLREFKSTNAEDFLKFTRKSRNGEAWFIYSGLNEKYASKDRSDNEAGTLLNDLQTITRCSEDRGVSFNDQMGRVFCFRDTGTQKYVKFSKFKNNSKYSSTLGYYINGEQRYEPEYGDLFGVKLDDEPALGHFYRDVTYFCDGKIRKFESAHKKWYTRYRTPKGNYVYSDKCVIQLNRASIEGLGGGEIFMATGQAKGAANQINWQEVEDADGYDVYYARCGKSMKKVKSTKTLKYIKKNLDRKANYKYRVKAYMKVNDEKAYIAASPVIHVAGSKSGCSNATKVTAEPAAIQMKVGETTSIKAKVVKKSGSKKVLWKHVKTKFRYDGTSGAVLIDGKGRITADSEGTSDIYVYAANGAFAKVTVTVEAEPENEE